MSESNDSQETEEYSDYSEGITASSTHVIANKKTTEITKVLFESDEEIVTRNKTIRRSYTIEKKLEFIKYFKNEGKNSINGTAKHFGVARTVIRGAENNEKRLNDVLSDRLKQTRLRRNKERERKPMCPEMDTNLILWFKERRAKGLIVTSMDIQIQALKIFRGLNPRSTIEFKASNGYHRRFLQRNKLKSRMATSVGQKIPEIYI